MESVGISCRTGWMDFKRRRNGKSLCPRQRYRNLLYRNERIDCVVQQFYTFSAKWLTMASTRQCFVATFCFSQVFRVSSSNRTRHSPKSKTVRRWRGSFSRAKFEKNSGKFQTELCTSRFRLQKLNHSGLRAEALCIISSNTRKL